jgi:Reverse transcriptase (RNA-dependent DNA polymerase)
MKKLNVYKLFPKRNIPRDKRCIKCRWVFDIKRNGIYRARLVACGYSQLPGVDFTDIYSPVLNDAVFRIVLLAQLKWKLPATIVDVETAFLHGNIEEEIYMDIPPGLNHTEGECVKLNKALYGLVQATRQFFKKFTQILQNIGFISSAADPCLFTKKDQFGRIFLVEHEDDSYATGDQQAVKIRVFVLLTV